MEVRPPTDRQREIEDSFRCKKARKRQKKHFLKSDVIKAELLKRGLNASDLAKRLGIGINPMYNRLQGVKNVKVNELTKLVKFMKMGRKEITELR